MNTVTNFDSSFEICSLDILPLDSFSSGRTAWADKRQGTSAKDLRCMSSWCLKALVHHILPCVKNWHLSKLVKLQALASPPRRETAERGNFNLGQLRNHHPY